MCGIGCCVWVTEIPKDEIEEICNSIRNRGPDSFGEYTIEDSNVHFAASVLRMRGSDVTPQPLISPSGDVFAWNGEVFGGLYIENGENDTQVVFKSIRNGSDVLSVMQQIQGPYSFIYFNKHDNAIYFGKDSIGRRSLIIHIDKNQQYLSIASSFKNTVNDSLSLQESSFLHLSQSAMSALYENECNEGTTVYKDIPPSGVFKLCLPTHSSHQLILDFIPFPRFISPCQISTSLSLQEDRLEAASHLMTLLESSLWKRVSTIDSFDENAHICVMFSGGIDCTLLVCLLCRVLKRKSVSCVIELVNIAYGDCIEEKEQESLHSIAQSFPDRYTAYQSFRDILTLFPSQPFRFIEMNIPNDEVIRNEESVLKCVFPGYTQMDYQIGCCYWLISRGEARCLSVDERNSQSIADAIQRSSQIAEELNEVTVTSENKCKTKNCQNVRDEECCMKMCQTCCLRVQKKALNLNLKKPQKQRTPIKCDYHCNQTVLTSPKKAGCFDVPFEKGTIHSKVLLSGIGADELCGGYSRYQVAYNRGGYEESWKEMTKDWDRLWYRNLGRDDRCISDHGREMRAPFLDEDVIHYLRSLCINEITDYSIPRGEGDKLILRLIASILNLKYCLTLSKRAIQFGSRIVKEYNTFMKVDTRESKGDRPYCRMSDHNQ